MISGSAAPICRLHFGAKPNSSWLSLTAFSGLTFLASSGSREVDLALGMPTFTSSFSQSITPLRHTWEHTVGSGHAELALRADHQTQLRRCHRELGFRYVRFHALLSHPMDALICQNNEWLYSFFNADQIFDFLFSIGMKPFVELSFMPEALASGTKTAFHYRANVTPPKSYREWAVLIRELAKHWIDRYGLAEVRSWFFEVWNEPNLDVFGSGKQKDYFKLYKVTARALKEVDASLQVGGPVTAKSAWIGDFVAYIEKAKLPADFISTHQYPTDAFGGPGDDTATQLGKSRRGIMREKALDAKREAGDRPLYYTEWSISSNPRDHLHDEPFAAAFATNILMSVDDVVDCYSWWTFSDIFNENYMPSVPFQGGFGLLNLHNIAKPVYRAFELLHGLGDTRFLVDGLHDTVSVWVIGKETRSATILLTNHALPHNQIRKENVRIQLRDVLPTATAILQRVDDNHANALAIWREMGKPDYLTPTQVDQLQAASELVREPFSLQQEGNTAEFEIDLPPNAVAAVSLVFDHTSRAKPRSSRPRKNHSS